MNILPYALPRNRSIEMMSTTISTNLNCNLACKHCYTLIGQFGYRENVMRSTVRKRYGEALR
ncbi:hypothetical protein EKL37_22785 [Pseudomonas aeruginosa]|nr:hypothetical protein EKL37_22785 [Pseudomonas aeruginosa]